MQAKGDTAVSEYDRQIQAYLDAIADKACFCDGDLFSLALRSDGPIRPGPNCEVRHQCPLFRSADWTQRNMKKWVGAGTEKDGCNAYRFWQTEKRRQEEDSREWIVKMDGESRVCTGRTADVAAARMWFELRAEGRDVDKMVLFDRQYSVRET